jgi:DNA polymerase-3 subunit delta'
MDQELIINNLILILAKTEFCPYVFKKEFYPMLFSQVVGQEKTKKDLINMWSQDHMPHALLILGAEGTGGLPLSLALAQYIFCTNKKDGDSCGVCPDCHKTGRLEHADLHMSFPSISPRPREKAMSRHYIQNFREFISQTPYGTTYDWLQFINAENKQGNLTAEECREMIDTLNLKSYEGGMKIQIIWRPEYLGKEGNILLKLIEEPPPKTLLILVAEDANEIIPTILSRTQLIKLAPIHAADIAQGLSDRSLADSRKASQIAHLANGSFTEALKLVKHMENDMFPDVRRWFNALFTNNGIELGKMVDDWSKNGREQQKNFLEFVIQLLEQTIRATYLPNIKPTLPDEESEFVKKLATKGLHHETLNEMIKAISKSNYHIERNAHSKSQLHALSVQMVRLVQGREVPEL